MSNGREIKDAQTMRALAHPVRLALLEALRRDGELTASRAAELLDESPGNMSWHLQTLARYGFIEESGSGKGRSRPWKLVDNASNTVRPDPADSAANAAVDALVEQLIQRDLNEARDWVHRRHSYPTEWQSAAFLSDQLTYLTAPELSALQSEMLALLDRYRDRTDRSRRPAGALPVRLNIGGRPLPETPAGN